ncbi:MAG TPA: hypothetical protein VMX13_02990 [Sedimentisphaerales bacterium]|nr:hypothetical protein [Sedimentisphaerales bacterium]
MNSRILVTAITVILLLFLAGRTCLAAEASEHEREDAAGFSLYSLIEPLGITTLGCVICTFLTGLVRRKLGRRFLKVHLVLGIISVILGVTHGTLVLILLG